ncbi:MAG: DUF1801 domain-containing protein [Planctomycetota bacterium]
MQSKAPTVAAYLEELPAERRTLLDAVRKVIRANLDKGIQEVMNYGMIGYVIPHSIYPDGYHCDPSKPFPYGGLASQKNYCSLYLFPVYAEAEDWFREEWKKGGKKLDIGKCCIRFKRLEDLDLEVLARALRRFTVAQTLQCYQQLLGNRAKPGKRRGASQPTSKPTSKPASKPASKRKLESKLDAGDEPGVKSGRGKPVGTAAKRAGKTTTSVAKVKAKAQPSKKQSRRG